MYCTNCGTERAANDPNACAKCGTPAPFFPPPPNIPNYLIHSIVVTLCCCLPFGIVALVFSAQVNSKLAAGDIAGAQASSKSAKTWVNVSVVAGILSIGGFAALSMLQ